MGWSKHSGFISYLRIFWLALALVGASLFAGCNTGETGRQNDTTKPPLPDDWKPVSYQGIEIYVPQSWPVEERATNQCHNGGGQFVQVGPPALTPSNCPVGNPKTGTVVMLGGPDTTPALGPETQQSINGVSVFVSSSAPGGPGPNNNYNEGPYIYSLLVRIPDHSAYLAMSSPGQTVESALGQARQIMSTIHTV